MAQKVQTWTTWLDLERFLTEQGIKFTWRPSFKVADIALDHARRINGRLEKVNTDKKNQYKEVLRVGSMPGLVIAKIGNEYVLLDGIQRISAAKELKIETVGVYIVEADPAVLNELATSINIRFNGLELTSQERKEKLKEEVRSILQEYVALSSDDRDELATRWQFSTETVRSIERAIKARDVLAEVGVLRPHKYDDDRAYHIARLGDAEGIKVLAKYVDEYNPATPQLRAIVTAAKEEVVPENRMKVLESHIRSAVPRTSRKQHTRSALTDKTVRRGQYDPARVPGQIAALASVALPANLKPTIAYLQGAPNLQEVLDNLTNVKTVVDRLLAKLAVV